MCCLLRGRGGGWRRLLSGPLLSEKVGVFSCVVRDSVFEPPGVEESSPCGPSLRQGLGSPGPLCLSWAIIPWRPHFQRGGHLMSCPVFKWTVLNVSAHRRPRLVMWKQSDIKRCSCPRGARAGGCTWKSRCVLGSKRFPPAIRHMLGQGQGILPWYPVKQA